MATLKYNDQEIELADDWRIGELIEAENSLGLDMNGAKGGAQMALVFYISIRRADKQIPNHVLADQVMRMELGSVAGDEDAPLEEGGPTNGEASPETVERLTTGSQPSERSTT